MRRLLPYPFLALNLALMWLLLSGFTRGHLVLAVIVSVAATHALAALGEVSPRIGRWLVLPEFIGIVLYDIARSNMSVAYIIVSGNLHERTSGFITIPLQLQHPLGLSILALVITSTPGTTWIDYDSARDKLLIHVFDLVDEDAWIALIKSRYEAPLREIFE